MILYKHYKGGLYQFLFEALHSETQERLVVYRGVETQKVWVRPFSMFFEKVTVDGKEVQRFTALNDVFRCLDCSGHNEAYMVYKELWKAMVPEDTGKGGFYVCLRCLEKRMKRPLQLEDFTEKPINDVIRFGYQLARRESGNANQQQGPDSGSSGPI